MVKHSWNPKQACRAARIDLELSWSDDRSRLAIFRVQYNVHYDNRQTAHLLSALRLERRTAAILSPQKNGAKITE